MTETAPCIVWFRQDLRLADNPALAAAVERGTPILPVYVLDESAGDDWKLGGAARWWLHQSLVALSKDLKKLGTPLCLRRGDSAEAIKALVQESGAAAVHWNRCYEPWAVKRDKALKAELKDAGVEFSATSAWTALQTIRHVRFRVHGRYAKGDVPGAHPKAPLSLVGRFLRLMVGWRLAGGAKRSPFFDPSTARPAVKPIVLTAEELGRAMDKQAHWPSPQV